MDLKSVLLGFLWSCDRTGYELKRAMDGSVGFFFGSSYGSIYPALKDLEQGGMVRMREVVQSGKPNKKVYSITPEGEKYFRSRLRKPPAEDSFRSEFLMQLFFGRHQEPELLLDLIEDYRASEESKLERLREVEERVPDGEKSYGFMCLRYGLISFEARLSWLDEVEEQVKKLAIEREVERTGG